MPLGVGDGEPFPGFLLAVFGDIFPREDVAVLAPEGAEELERPAPPRALAVGSSFIGSRRRNVQDARKLALVLVLHLHGSNCGCTHNQSDANGTATYMQRSCTELKNSSI